MSHPQDWTPTLGVDELVNTFGLFYVACSAAGVPPLSSEVVDGDTEPNVIELALHLEGDQKMPGAEFLSTAGWYTTPFNTVTLRQRAGSSPAWRKTIVDTWHR